MRGYKVQCNKRMQFSIQIEFKSNVSTKEMKPPLEQMMRMLENVIKFERKHIPSNKCDWIYWNRTETSTRGKHAEGQCCSQLIVQFECSRAICSHIRERMKRWQAPWRKNAHFDIVFTELLLCSVVILIYMVMMFNGIH